MYFSDISNKELCLFHGLKVQNFSISLSEILDSDLFHVETIIQDKILRIYPLFYTTQITSTNPNDNIIENKVIVAQKNDETYFTFISDENEEVMNYKNFVEYYKLEDNLSTTEYNTIVSLLRANTINTDNFNLKQGIVNGEYGDYTFNIESTTIVDNGILITNETLSNLGTVKLTGKKFKSSNYNLHLQVFSYDDPNIELGDILNEVEITELIVPLLENQEVIMPFDTLELANVVGFNATVYIDHDSPVVLDWIMNLELLNTKEIIQKNEILDIVALATDSSGVGVAGKTVHFFECFEPKLLNLIGDKSIIQIGDILNLNATFKDEDGSLIVGEKVYFYEKYEED